MIEITFSSKRVSTIRIIMNVTQILSALDFINAQGTDFTIKKILIETHETQFIARI